MTADVHQLRVPLTKNGAYMIIRKAAERSELISWSQHVMNDKIPETGIVARQILSVLANGSMNKDPAWDEEHQDYICVLRRVVSGRSVSVVVGIVPGYDEMEIVTVY